MGRPFNLICYSYPQENFQFGVAGSAALKPSLQPNPEGVPNVPSVFLVDDSQGLLITTPDVLVSPTRVAESCVCIRKGVLGETVKSPGKAASGSNNEAAVLGNVRHQFYEVIIVLYSFYAFLLQLFAMFCFFFTRKQ